jgi:hypothetical protein
MVLPLIHQNAQRHMKNKKSYSVTTERPKVGDEMTVWGVACKITKVWPFGTVDVLSLDGKNARRVTGLNFL